MSELTEFEEMYLKRIFESHADDPSEIVRTTKLADLMEVSAASTTEMIQKLALRDYVTYIPYKGCRLTSEGFKHASRIKRREELLKILLSDIIRFEGDVDSVACKIEHSIDMDLEASIDRMLGYPERNKEGEMIPSIDRSMVLSSSNTLLPLSALPDDTPSIIEIIYSSGVTIKTLEKSGIKIGSSIIKKSDKFYCDGNEIVFSREFSFKVIVRVE
jgi:DtxR family Mn-dependent transcriptional regulator